MRNHMRNTKAAYAKYNIDKRAPKGNDREHFKRPDWMSPAQVCKLYTIEDKLNAPALGE